MKHLSPKDQAILERIIAQLSTKFDLESVLLFGSRARGTAQEHSDYDVLVVAKSKLPFFRRQYLAQELVSPRDFPLDLLVYTPSEYEDAVKKMGSTAYWASIEGQEVYAG